MEALKTLAFMDSQEVVERLAPDSFIVLKFGINEYTKDGVKSQFNFTPEMAKDIRDEHLGRGKDLVVDFEHSTLNREYAGQGKAPACGWVKGFEVADDGLVAVIEHWLPSGRKALEGGEYRYMSPVLRFDDADGVSSIHSIALTNHPAFHGYEALVAANDSSSNTNNIKGNEMDRIKELKELASGLFETRNEVDEALTEAFSDLVSETEGKDEAIHDDVRSFCEGFVDTEDKKEIVSHEFIGGLLNLSDVSEDSIRGKVESFNGIAKEVTELKKEKSAFLAAYEVKSFSDVTNIFQKREVDLVKKEEDFNKKSLQDEAKRAVELALNEGKIIESKRQWAMDYVTKHGLAAFNSMVPMLPTQVNTFTTKTRSEVPREENVSSFSDDELRLQKAMGLPDDEIIALRKKIKS